MRASALSCLLALMLTCGSAQTANAKGVKSTGSSAADTLFNVLNARGDSTWVANLLSVVDYGIPQSPAFALLPDKPEQVTHALTAHDLQAGATSWFDGNKLRAGIAVDTRPFVRSAGSLAKYRHTAGRRQLFGTVLSFGTATASKGSDDVIGAVGLRVPIVDRGDPRADDELVNALARSVIQDLSGPDTASDFDTATAATVTEELKSGQAKRQKLLSEFAAKHWNAFRWDFGIAASARSGGGVLSRDSLERNRAGVWTSLSFGVGSFSQLTIAANSVWVRADTVHQETSRQLAGARLKLFLSDSFAASAEVAKNWSKHEDAGSLDADWQHVAVALEAHVPELKGWIGIGYGGDTPHRNRPADGLQIKYAYYRDRIVKQ